METQEKRKLQFLLALPVLVVPLLAIAFYAMGGGKGEAKHRASQANGINSDLPDAKFGKEDPKDKFSFYAQTPHDTTEDKNAIHNVAGRLKFNANEDDSQTDEINQKLEILNREINRPEKPLSGIPETKPAKLSGNTSLKPDVDRLETLMRSLQTPNEDDPEIQQLTAMMERILDIQHPERLKEKYEAKGAEKADSLFQAIPAIIEGDQKITAGSVIKLRLQDTITLNGQTIPEGQLLYGTAVLTNQRILLDITTVRLGTSIIPVNLSVYGLDGIKGIDAPEAVFKEAANGGASSVVRDIRLPGIDQSLAGQVAEAGLDAAKSFVGKKVKRIKVKLKSGQSVLLRNNDKKKF